MSCQKQQPRAESFAAAVQQGMSCFGNGFVFPLKLLSKKDLRLLDLGGNEPEKGRYL